MRPDSFIPEFVETMPEELDEGRLYISSRFRTASHLCACGCGSRVVTPLKPAKWELTNVDGIVSLSPSIGRWQLPCKSHYWIRDNQVIWSGPLSEDDMQAVLDRDARDLHDYYGARRKPRWIPVLVLNLWRRWFGGKKR